MPSPGGENMPNGVSSPSNQQNSPNGTNRSATLENTSSQSNAKQSTAPTANGTQITAQSSQSTQNRSNGARPPSQSRNSPDPSERKKPRNARLIHMVLANQGVRSYEDRVPLQLMDFAYRYSIGVLQDAISLGDSSIMNSGGRGGGGAGAGAGDSAVSNASLKLAIGARLGRQFNPHLPKEFMMDIAQERNKVAIPRVEKSFGHRLPPEQFCLTGTGWGIKDEWMSEVDDDGEEPLDVALNKEGKEGESGDTIMGEAEDEDMEQFEEVMMGGGG